MPTYPIKCQCGFGGEAFCHAADLLDGKPPCPECGQRAEQDWTRKGVPGMVRNEFHGRRRESMEIQAQPYEVPKLRRMYGDAVGDCWQQDGSVKFRDKDEARRFFTKDDEIRRKAADAKAERAAKGLPPVVRAKKKRPARRPRP